MASYDITTHWTGKDIAFKADIEGFDVRMDSVSDGMADGPSPKRLMLASLLGCTGMDVASLMQKMRISFEAFSVNAVAPLTEEHPKVFKSVHLRYKVIGTDIKREKVEKAINLSQTTYCGVSIMLKKHCPVTWELEIVDA